MFVKFNVFTGPLTTLSLTEVIPIANPPVGSNNCIPFTLSPPPLIATSPSISTLISVLAFVPIPRLP